MGPIFALAIHQHLLFSPIGIVFDEKGMMGTHVLPAQKPTMI
jgi:hypothetical protein